MTPRVDQQRRGFSVSRFDPRREQPSLVGLVPQILVEVSIGDLLKWLNVIHWDKMAAEQEESIP